VGIIAMVDNKSRFRSFAPDLDGFDEEEDFTDTSAQRPTYRFGRSAQDNYQDNYRDSYTAEPSVPMFLSDPDSDPDPEEFAAPLRKRGMASVSSKILMAVVAASGVAMLFAWFSSDATRDMIVDAKASIAAALPTPSATAQADAAQLTSGDLQLRDPARSGAPLVQPQAAAPAQAPVVVANVAPSREEITNAYQSALRAPVAVVPPAAPQAAAPAPALMPQAPMTQAPMPQAPMPQAPMPQVKQMDAQELATLMKRAKDMLAMGDIPVARLLLERAAEGQDAKAALLLARTYDPAVLGTSDVRNITPEPDKARAWYKKAAQLGSAEAQQRLAQLPN
jgi:TPR repeat protein